MYIYSIILDIILYFKVSIYCIYVLYFAVSIYCPYELYSTMLSRIIVLHLELSSREKAKTDNILIAIPNFYWTKRNQPINQENRIYIYIYKSASIASAV